MTVLFVLAGILSALLLFRIGIYLIGRIKYYRRSHHLALQRLQLLRRLLGMAYVYASNPPLFMKKFREEVSIGHLECCDVICNYDEQRRLAAEKSLTHTVKNKDILLCILIDKGFTPQELSVVYGMSNHNSIYVRCSRIRKSGKNPDKQIESQLQK